MAQNVLIWSKVKIEVSSAFGSAIPITGIAMGSSTVVTYTGTDPANGDELLFSIVGPSEIADRVYRVASVNVGAKTFVIEGLDGTGLDPFVSGSAKKITAYASSGIITNVNSSGGEFKTAQTATVHDDIESEVPTVATAFKMDFEAFFSLTDAFFVEANKASKTKTVRVARVRFPGGARLLGSAFVSALGVPNGSAFEVVKQKIGLNFQGLPTIYAS